MLQNSAPDFYSLLTSPSVIPPHFGALKYHLWWITLTYLPLVTTFPLNSKAFIQPPTSISNRHHTHNIICKNLGYSHPICSPYRLQHLNKWWLHSSSCSDQTSRRYPWLRALCAIFWLCIQSQKDPTTLNTATHHPGRHLSPGFLPCPLIGLQCFHFCLPTHGCQSNPIKTEGRYHNHSSALYHAVVSNLLQNNNQSPFHGLWGPTKSCTQLSLISLHIHSFHSIHTDLLLPLISQKSSALGPLLLPLSRMLSLASMSIQIGQLLYFHLRSYTLTNVVFLDHYIYNNIFIPFTLPYFFVLVPPRIYVFISYLFIVYWLLLRI